MKNWLWKYGYRLNYCHVISDEPWPTSLFYIEAEACRREAIRRGEQTTPVSLDDFNT